MMDLRESGLVYAPDLTPGGIVKWFLPQPGMSLDLTTGEDVAWLTPSGECFGTVSELGAELHGGHRYQFAAVVVDRVSPRG